MGKEIIFDRPEITVWLHTHEGIIHHQMHRYPGVKILEAALRKGSERLGPGVSKWLSDDRKGGALPKSHHQWAEQVWGPESATAGWRFWALLPPTELVGQMNMKRLQEIYAALGVSVRVFDNPETAFAWLCEQ